jgi:hypothetical protein
MGSSSSSGRERLHVQFAATAAAAAAAAANAKVGENGVGCVAFPSRLVVAEWWGEGGTEGK